MINVISVSCKLNKDRKEVIIKYQIDHELQPILIKAHTDYNQDPALSDLRNAVNLFIST